MATWICLTAVQLFPVVTDPFLKESERMRWSVCMYIPPIFMDVKRWNEFYLNVKANVSLFSAVCVRARVTRCMCTFTDWYFESMLCIISMCSFYKETMKC